jgi:hypothetical protein
MVAKLKQIQITLDTFGKYDFAHTFTYAQSMSDVFSQLQSNSFELNTTCQQSNGNDTSKIPQNTSTPHVTENMSLLICYVSELSIPNPMKV